MFVSVTKALPWLQYRGYLVCDAVILETKTLCACSAFLEANGSSQRQAAWLLCTWMLSSANVTRLSSQNTLVRTWHLYLPV